LTELELSGYLDIMVHRKGGLKNDRGADARAALKVALERLSQTRQVPVGEYPRCIRLLRDLRDEADHWLVLFVREAVEGGSTWADVGDMLGVSRQAAHERYAPQILALARQTVEGDARRRAVR
jgi:hypothetical protein